MLRGINFNLITVYYDFSPGSTAYRIDQAEEAIIEPVTIKEVRVVYNQNSAYQFEPVYVDIFDEIWNDYDLCTETVARQLAINYLNRERDMIIANLQDLGVTV